MIKKSHYKVKSQKIEGIGKQTIVLREADTDGSTYPYTGITFERELDLDTGKWNEWRTVTSVYHPVDRITRFLKEFNKIIKHA